jgi:hypothetical protein
LPEKVASQRTTDDRRGHLSKELAKYRQMAKHRHFVLFQIPYFQRFTIGIRFAYIQLPCLDPDMSLRIEKKAEGPDMIIRLSGRIRSGTLLELKKHLEGVTERIVIDMEEVTLVDLDVVRFLTLCESRGMELRNCSPYIREWILRERKEE